MEDDTQALKNKISALELENKTLKGKSGGGATSSSPYDNSGGGDWKNFSGGGS